MEIIRIEGIRHAYEKKEILKGITLSIDNSDLIAITGENGSGKTTLLNIIALLIKPNSGQIYYGDKLLDLSKNKERDEYRRERIGIVSQDFSLIYDLNVFDNIALSLQAQRLSAKVIKQRVNQTITELGLENLSKKYPGALSGGECQKVAIARALVKGPELILADELTASLDTENKTEIIKLLLKLSKKDIAIVIVTHDKEVLSFMSKVYLIQEGKLIALNGKEQV